jgi:hypothetical protein
VKKLSTEYLLLKSDRSNSNGAPTHGFIKHLPIKKKKKNLELKLHNLREKLKLDVICCHPITQLLTQLLTFIFIFLLNKKSKNHVKGSGLVLCFLIYIYI